MAITATDLKLRLSGGASNTSAAAALGGAMSTVGGGIITTDQLNNLWDDVSGDESEAGDTEYRGIYVRNEHGSLTWTNPVIWIESQTPSGDTVIEIALADEAASVAMETIANENTAPTGPSFSQPANKAAGLALTSLAPNAYRGVWVKRIVSASASAYDNDTYTLKYSGETSA